MAMVCSAGRPTPGLARSPLSAYGITPHLSYIGPTLPPVRRPLALLPWTDDHALIKGCPQPVCLPILTTITPASLAAVSATAASAVAAAAAAPAAAAFAATLSAQAALSAAIAAVAAVATASAAVAAGTSSTAARAAGRSAATVAVAVATRAA